MGSHNHHHEGNAEFDPGVMYKEQWVQDLVQKLQTYVSSNADWIDLKKDGSSQRVLDYACGHGTISLALAESFPNATFQGIDIHHAQVRRFNEEAEKLFGTSHKDRMFALEGDLTNPSAQLESEEWKNFDVAIMSMALHHVPDPVDMLKRLKQRLRSGGRLMIVEWFSEGEEDSGTEGHGHGHHHHHHQHSHDPKLPDMIEVVGGQKIFPGFGPDALRRLFAAAGFQTDAVDVRVPGLGFRMPDGAFEEGEKKLVFVRAVVS